MYTKQNHPANIALEKTYKCISIKNESLYHPSLHYFVTASYHLPDLTFSLQKQLLGSHGVDGHQWIIGSHIPLRLIKCIAKGALLHMHIHRSCQHKMHYNTNIIFQTKIHVQQNTDVPWLKSPKPFWPCTCHVHMFVDMHIDKLMHYFMLKCTDRKHTHIIL